MMGVVVGSSYPLKNRDRTAIPSCSNAARTCSPSELWLAELISEHYYRAIRVIIVLLFTPPTTPSSKVRDNDIECGGVAIRHSQG